MCGIVGYIGKNGKALPTLLNGLKCLEYRGYDSAGVAFVQKNKVDIIKATGQIVNLEAKVDESLESNLGLGHTRWATHGVPNEVNSHPHKVGKITIVHNGIIENYADLKDKLIKSGVKFKSETDTEVACALLNENYKETGDMLESIKMFKQDAKGSYAIGIICDDDLDNLYVIKKASPLIVGLGKNENYIASDVPAIIKYTKKYLILNDGEYAKISDKDIIVYDNKNEIKINDVKTFSGDEASIDKNGYEHFMLKEIHEEPAVIKRLFTKYIVDEKFETIPSIDEYKDVTIVACGSAMHAGLIGKYVIEKNLNIPVTVEIASEFRYKNLFIDEKSLVIVISQSGETADTLAAAKMAKNYGAHTIGIVNVKESSIAREVDEVIYTEAGSEIAVATTKAYEAQAMILMLIAIKKNFDDKKLIEIQKIPVQMEKTIAMADKLTKIAEYLKSKEDIFFIGRLIDYALCMEGSLKLKEISYIHSEAYAAGELKHGTISLIEEDTPVIAIVTDENIAEKTISNIKEVKARGARVILIITEKLNFIGDCYDEKVVIPNTVEAMESLLTVLPLQIIAYNVAKLRYCSIDKPKNLAKSVTVE